jgi:hypothetical protein
MQPVSKTNENKIKMAYCPIPSSSFLGTKPQLIVANPI